RVLFRSGRGAERPQTEHEKHGARGGAPADRARGAGRSARKRKVKPMQLKPSFDEMKALVGQGNLCPIYAEVLADLETPVSAFLKVARGPWSFLLESVEGGTHIARYSFIGAEPYLTLRFDGGTAHAVQGGYKQTLPYDDPLRLLGSYMGDYRPVRLPDLPLFVGGAVGYLAYDAVDRFERLPRPERRAPY